MLLLLSVILPFYGDLFHMAAATGNTTETVSVTPVGYLPPCVF